jgi:hypothetical protein
MRQHVRVWTSGNRVYGCSSPGLLAAVADALASGRAIGHAAETYLGRRPDRAEHEAITHAATQLDELARAETASSRIVGQHGDDLTADRSTS